MLQGKHALITGARRGIGAAIVEAFAREGCCIWAQARKHDDEFEARLSSLSAHYGTKIEPVYFDLADYDEMKAVVKRIRQSKESLDVLVNNAGVVGGDGTVAMTPIDTYRQVFETNLFAQIKLAQLVARIMLRQKSGSIINMCSVAGIDSAPGSGEYASSKAALGMMTKKLAVELGMSGIRVNALAPGIVNTDMGAGVHPEITERVLSCTALRRIGEPAEIANAAVFLASDYSSYVTGQIIRVDGGGALAFDRLERH